MHKFLTERFSILLVWTGILFFFIGLVVFQWRETIFEFSSPINSDKIGQLGDFIGGFVGSIWALAGVILFYVALGQQLKDLKINIDTLNQQIKEFELQRKELEETRKVMELQSNTLQTQQFETTFFNVLDIYINITRELKQKEPRFFSSKINDCYNEASGKLKKNPEKAKVTMAINLLIKRESPNFQHYIQTLFQMVRFVSDHHLFVNDTRYIDLIKAQLSPQELRLLYYLTHYSDHLPERFVKLIETYTLFEFMDASYLLNPQHTIENIGS